MAPHRQRCVTFLPVFHHTHHTQQTPPCLRHMTQPCLACPCSQNHWLIPVLHLSIGTSCVSCFPFDTCRDPLLCSSRARALPPTYNACSAPGLSRSVSNQRLPPKPAICSLRLARPGDARRESQCLLPPRSRLHLRHSNDHLQARRRMPTKRICRQTLTYKTLLQSPGL